MTETTDTEIETGENWKGEPTIKNVDEVREVIEDDELAFMVPDGSEVPFELDNPYENSDPTGLRVYGHRKALWFKVIKRANEMGLTVKDVWQHDDDLEEDKIAMNIQPES